MRFIGALSLILINFSVFAANREEHQLVRRIVVFPMDVEREYAKEAENVWWDLREKLSESKRFLILSKNFMQTKDVLQPRGELDAAEAILLGRLLDANALITTSLKGKILTMRAYEAPRGRLLWQQSLELHPSIPVSKQLPENARRLLLDFVASIPYQGYVVTDTLVGRPISKEGDNYRVMVDLGANTQAQKGDQIQLLDFQVTSIQPFFQGGLSPEVIGEGVITKIDKGIASVTVQRLKDSSLVKDQGFVRLPGEFKRLRDAYLINTKAVGGELRYLDTGTELTDRQKEKKPLVTAVSFFANLALILAIAF